MQTTGGVTLLDIYRRLYPKTLLADVTLARAGGGVTHPHEFFFWNCRRTAGRILLTFCIAYGASFA